MLCYHQEITRRMLLISLYTLIYLSIWKVEVAAAITSEMKTIEMESTLPVFLSVSFASMFIVGMPDGQNFIYMLIPSVYGS